MAREIREETGLIIVTGEMLSRYVFEVEPSSWVNIITYGCSVVGGHNIVSSDEHQTVAFVDPRELERLRLPDGYRQAITAWRSR